MSKLRLRGSTSGYTEIQASAVAGDNIITLPTTSDGTILTADSSGNVNIDSGTLYVDAANNRVGVGTTSVSRTLDVRGSGLVSCNIGSTNASSAYLFLDGNSNGDSVWLSPSDSGKLVFGKEHITRMPVAVHNLLGPRIET